MKHKENDLRNDRIFQCSGIGAIFDDLYLKKKYVNIGI